MSLIRCPECGREGVSDRASACPSCAFPISPVRSQPTALINTQPPLMAGQKPDNEQREKAPLQKQTQITDKACPICELTNPGTAMQCDCGFDFITGKVAAAPLAVATLNKRTVQTGNPTAYLGLVFGLGSILLGFTGIIPVCALLFSVHGLRSSSHVAGKGNISAGIGLFFGVIYTIVWFNAPDKFGFWKAIFSNMLQQNQP